jgi:hypothetical protein
MAKKPAFPAKKDAIKQIAKGKVALAAMTNPTAANPKQTYGKGKKK